MDLSDFRADADLQRDGVTIPFGSFTEITIRSASDEKFSSYWNKLKKRHQREIDNEKLPAHVGRELLAKAISQRMVLGWKFMVIPKSMYENDFGQIPKEAIIIPGQLECKPAEHKDFDMEMVEIPYSKKNVFTVLNHKNYGSVRGWLMVQASELANFQNEDFEDDLGN